MESSAQEAQPQHPQRVRAARRVMFPQAARPALDTLGEIICEPTRAKIVRALMAAELTVGDLALVIERSPSSTSQHLRVLRNLGLVRSRRRGRQVYNRLADDAVTAAARSILSTVSDLASRMAATGAK